MRAEYDHTNNRVVQVETDDGRKIPTYEARVLGSETEWLPVQVEYPVGYEARFHTLLNPDNIRYDYDEEQARVIVRYPEADFSAEAIRANLAQMIRDRVKIMLGETDWAIVRSVETGKSVPDDISSEREMLRGRADSLLAALDNTADEDLVNFDFTFDYDEPGRVYATSVVVEGADGREWITTATHPGEEGDPVRPAEDDEYDPNRNPRPVIAESKDEGVPWLREPGAEDDQK